MSDLTRKERMALPRAEAPERPAEDRRRDFAEVGLGYTTELAMLEADRCLRCPRPKCVEGCPVGVRIDLFVTAVSEGDLAGAAEVIARDNSLPAVCGRVCPQEAQCEGTCVLAGKGRPIAIGHLERFVADWEREHGEGSGAAPAPPTGKLVAIVGSGPAGLACASDLARWGHQVTVYEALHEPGGVLVYGIPEFRLPKAIVRAEIERLRDMGVAFVTDAPVGMAETVSELLEQHDAVFLGVGAGLPKFLGIPGENLIGVYSANEFLTRVNLMRAWQPHAETPVYDLHERRVAVFGGGNTAIDAARTAVRMGAASVTIFYRRTREEMPARAEEVRHAGEEGVRLEFLVAPVELVGDADEWLREVVLQRMDLGEPDASGRRRPVPVPGSEFREPVDVVIVAVGNDPNPLIRRSDPSIRHTRWGTVEADPDTGRTTRRGVFAGGDIVTGGATVILAMGAGRRAARSIDEYLRTGIWEADEAGGPEGAPG
jgi:glutamate synthase (NADPH) small chain